MCRQKSLPSGRLFDFGVQTLFMLSHRTGRGGELGVIHHDPAIIQVRVIRAVGLLDSQNRVEVAWPQFVG